MKKTVLLSLVTLFFLCFSCEKWGKEKNNVDTYYSEDYRNTNHEYLGENAADLDELYFHFYNDKDRSNRYKFVGEMDDDYVYHEGSYVKTETAIQFIPDDSSHPSFEGIFTEDGKTLTISYPGVEENRVQVTFNWKENKKHECGWGK